jgi:hypothetical protein
LRSADLSVAFLVAGLVAPGKENETKSAKKKQKRRAIAFTFASVFGLIELMTSYSFSFVFEAGMSSGPVHRWATASRTVSGVV